MKQYFTLLTFSFLSTASCVNAGRFDIEAIFEDDIPATRLEELCIKESAMQAKITRLQKSGANRDVVIGYAEKIHAINLAQQSLKLKAFGENHALEKEMSIKKFNEAREMIQKGKKYQALIEASTSASKLADKEKEQEKTWENGENASPILNFGKYSDDLADYEYGKPGDEEKSEKKREDDDKESAAIFIDGHRYSLSLFEDVKPGEEKVQGKASRALEWKSYEAPVLDWDEHISGGVLMGDVYFTDSKNNRWVYENGNQIAAGMEGYQEKEPEARPTNLVARKIKAKYKTNVSVAKQELNKHFSTLAAQHPEYIGKYGFCYKISGVTTPLFLVQEDSL